MRLTSVLSTDRRLHEILVMLRSERDRLEVTIEALEKLELARFSPWSKVDGSGRAKSYVALTRYWETWTQQKCRAGWKSQSTGSPALIQVASLYALGSRCSRRGRGAW
jgi:hypothetical protein